MYEKLSVFEDKLIELEKDLSSVEVINDSKLYQQKAIEPVSYTHLTLPTTRLVCRSRWSPYH